MLSARQAQARPRSSTSCSPYHRRQARFNGNQELNNVTSSIHRTFSRENRSWNEIKGLTIERVDKKFERTIDNLCIKYSIAPSRKHGQWMSHSVDVDFLVKNHMRNKSRQEEKRKSRIDLRKEIKQIACRHQKLTAKPFFKMSRANLLSISEKSKNDGDQSSVRKHPYMMYYEQQQKQALMSITEGVGLQLALEKDYPPLIEVEQWEREHFKVKKIYSYLRDKASVARNKRFSQAEISQFFITE